MAVKKYSLLDYTVTLGIDGTSESISLGGKGSFLGSISVERDTPNITKTVDATGSGVYAFSADNSGTITFNLTYISNAANEIMNKLVGKYHATNVNAWKDNSSLTITIMKDDRPVIVAKHCMFAGLDSLELGPEVPTRNYPFLAMEISEVNTDLNN